MKTTIAMMFCALWMSNASAQTSTERQPRSQETAMMCPMHDGHSSMNERGEEGMGFSQVRLYCMCGDSRRGNKESQRSLPRNRASSAGCWLLQHASFCAPHAIELKKQLLVPEQRAIEEALARHASELEGQLEEFLKKLKKGNHTGGGVLGRTAEFLACQRGILH
jgi:hypothetical protein